MTGLHKLNCGGETRAENRAKKKIQKNSSTQISKSPQIDKNKIKIRNLRGWLF